MGKEDHGLTVEEVPRLLYATGIPAGSEPCISDLPDLRGVPLGEIAEAARDDDTLRRISPRDGTVLLVAASFNSAI